MFLDSHKKIECFGCESCVQACPRDAIFMTEDDEGFRYPVIDQNKCVECGVCRAVCPYVRMPVKHETGKYVFGGYNSDPQERFESTSGGAFCAIVNAYCDENYVIFGAEAKGLDVFHSYITDKKDIGRFRKSKYSQSVIGNSYKDVHRFLKEGKKVLFSGTPCQIAGLLSFLGETNRNNLLTVEVICEGVPSPLYIRKLNEYIIEKYGSPVKTIDYRYTGKGILSKWKWDFEIMKIEWKGNEKGKFKDRWFNPFWSIWLQHLMTRPSCYKCPYTTIGRIADISLGDLWGVHIYCPELYGDNGGSSLVVCNTGKGKEEFVRAMDHMYGHELEFEEAIKYQSPMRKCIDNNPCRSDFIKDLQSDMDYRTINKKWAKPPTIKLLFQKYIWGNRQKIYVWKSMSKGKTNA